MKTHFVTGATGYIGRELVETLLNKREKVIILVRAKRHKSGQTRAYEIFGNQKNLNVIEGDIRFKNLKIQKEELKSLKRQKVDFVWHLAANLSFSQSSKRRQKFITNVKGTKMVVSLANDLKSVLCHFSTAFVCGDSKVFSEANLDIGQKFRNHYEETKFLAEKVIREKCKTPFIIFRPSKVIDKAIISKALDCTFGYYRYLFLFLGLKKWLLKITNERKTLSMFIKSMSPFFILPCPKNIFMNMISIDYVVKNAYKIALNKSAYNKTFHLTHPVPRSLIFHMNAIIDDLSLKRMKFFEVNPQAFKIFIYSLYVVLIPVRSYMKSALLYLPYVSTSPVFLRKNVSLYNTRPKISSRDFLKKVHGQAYEIIFSKIKI